MGDNYIVNLRAPVSDEPLAPASVQPSLSNRLGYTTARPVLVDGIGSPTTANINPTNDFRYMGLQQQAFFQGTGGNIRMLTPQWQQADEALIGVCNVYYAFTIPWANLKATLGSGGGEFGYFYFGLWRAAEDVGNEPSVTISLVDSTGATWGTSHTFQPTVQTDPQRLERISLTTANFFGSWPTTTGFDLSDTKLMNLVVSLQAKALGGQTFHTWFGDGEIYFSHVPAVKQNAQW